MISTGGLDRRILTCSLGGGSWWHKRERRRLHDRLLSHKKASNTLNCLPSSDRKKTSLMPSRTMAKSPPSRRGVSCMPEKRRMPKSAVARTAMRQPLPVDVDNEIVEENGARSLYDILVLLNRDWKPLMACMLATLTSVGASVCVAPSLGHVIDVISASDTTPRRLCAAVVTLGIVYIVSNVALAAQVALASDTAESIGAHLRARLFRALLRREVTFHDVTKTGEMTSWLGQDIEVVQSTIARLLGARGLRAILETTGIVLMLAWLSWPLALALLAAAPLVTPVVASATKRIKKESKNAEIENAATSAAADEMIENVKAIRVFGAEEREVRRYFGLVDVAHKLAKDVIKLQAILDVSGRIRNITCVLVTLTVGAHLALAGRISIGVCYSFFVYSFSFAFALGNVTATMGELSKAAGTISRMMSVVYKCEKEDANDEAPGRRRLAASEGPPDVGADDGHDNGANGSQPRYETMQTTRRSGGSLIPEVCYGDIEFRNVSFVHPSGWALEDINLHVPAGKTLALVGPSGGGKSTIAALLLGLYRPSSGKIVVDGNDLMDLDMQWWRRQVGVVEQSPGLLNGRIRDIVGYGRIGADDQEVVEALEAAQADDFVMALPGFLETQVGPGGVAALSGGQRQRLALARALLKNPKVLVLDEATSALDVGTEAAVTSALDNVAKPMTKIIIAHRLSTIRRADMIVVLAGGRIAEFGQHDDLIERGGAYSKMILSLKQDK